MVCGAQQLHTTIGLITGFQEPRQVIKLILSSESKVREGYQQGMVERGFGEKWLIKNGSHFWVDLFPWPHLNILRFWVFLIMQDFVVLVFWRGVSINLTKGRNKALCLHQRHHFEVFQHLEEHTPKEVSAYKTSVTYMWESLLDHPFQIPTIYFKILSSAKLHESFFLRYIIPQIQKHDKLSPQP